MARPLYDGYSCMTATEHSSACTIRRRALRTVSVATAAAAPGGTPGRGGRGDGGGGGYTGAAGGVSGVYDGGGGEGLGGVSGGKGGWATPGGGAGSLQPVRTGPRVREAPLVLGKRATRVAEGAEGAAVLQPPSLGRASFTLSCGGTKGREVCGAGERG